MFWAWKDTILSHYRLLSGKGLKNEKHRSSDTLSLYHSKLIPCALQLRRRPIARKFGATERRRLRPFVLRSWLCQEQPNNAYLAHIYGVRIIELAHPVCQTYLVAVGLHRAVYLSMRC